MKNENHVFLLACLLFTTNCQPAKLADVRKLEYQKQRIDNNIKNIQPQHINAFLSEEASPQPKPERSLLFPCEDQTNFVYKNVNFTCNSKLGLKVETRELTEVPLDYETDTGDGVHPDYFSFKLREGIAYKEKNSAYELGVDVYPIDDYRRMFSISDKKAEQFDREMKILQKVIAEQPAEPDKQGYSMPLLNGSVQLFMKQVKYPSFKNGKGVAFLTQFSNGFENITNRALIFVFQGITEDNKYYINARFPVSTKLLPAYKKDLLNESKDLEQIYSRYVSDTAEKLENLQPNQYKPDLDEITKLISSIEVK